MQLLGEGLATTRSDAEVQKASAQARAARERHEAKPEDLTLASEAEAAQLAFETRVLAKLRKARPASVALIDARLSEIEARQKALGKPAPAAGSTASPEAKPPAGKEPDHSAPAERPSS
ncbi:hypothetical protein DB347_22795 [Opitutaceae bacterium EW11]|nr:hypothetical protein DB347_22795 [Opitutaceae bacterium EW11]